MEDSKQTLSKPLGIIISIFLISGIMAFLWGILHLLLPLRNAEIFGLIALAIIIVVSRAIYNWIVEKTLLIHAILLICIFWSLAWALYIQIQTVQ